LKVRGVAGCVRAVLDVVVDEDDPEQREQAVHAQKPIFKGMAFSPTLLQGLEAGIGDGKRSCGPESPCDDAKSPRRESSF
jgi:hypothetical protein